MSVLFKALNASNREARGGDPGKRPVVNPADPAAALEGDAADFAQQALPGGYLKRKQQRRQQRLLLIALILSATIVGGLFLFDEMRTGELAEPARDMARQIPVIGPLFDPNRNRQDVVVPLSDRLAAREQAAQPESAAVPEPVEATGPVTGPVTPPVTGPDPESTVPSEQIQSAAAPDEPPPTPLSPLSQLLQQENPPTASAEPVRRTPPPDRTVTARRQPSRMPPETVTVRHGEPAGIEVIRAIRADGTMSSGAQTQAERLDRHRRANTALRNADPALAATLYRDLAASNPDDLTALFGLATALQRLGETEEARMHYETLLSRQPNNREALGNLIALIGQSEPRSAVAQLESLRADYPETAALSAQLARLHGQLGNFDAAIAAARDAVERDRDNPLMHYNLAVLLDRAGNPGAAAQAYRRVLALAREGDARARTLPLEDLQARLEHLAEASASP